MVRLHSAAITLGPLVVRSWRWYLSKTTSRAQIEVVLYPQCCGPKKHGPWAGSSPGRTVSTCLGPLLVRVCRAWTNSDDCWEAYRSSARTSSFPCIRSQSDRLLSRAIPRTPGAAYCQCSRHSRLGRFGKPLTSPMEVAGRCPEASARVAPDLKTLPAIYCS